MSELYNAPRYYDAAFSYRDIRQETAVMVACMAQHSGIPLENVVELACGHAPYASEWANRGFHYTGIDLSPVMLDYGQSLHRDAGGRVDLRQGDMLDFALETQADFAYVLLASLYAQSTDGLVAHYNAVARALRPGGLYVLEWCVEFDPLSDVAETWRVDRDGLAIQATYYTRWRNRVDQILQESIHLDISEDDRTFVLQDTYTRRVCFPQEFRAFIRDRTAFDFVGWWNNWNLDDPIDGTRPVSRPIIVLRRRQD